MTSKLSGLQHDWHESPVSCVGQEFGGNLAGQFCPSSLVRSPSWPRPGVQSSEDLPGWLASWHCGWQEASVLCHVGHATALLECPHNVPLASPTASDLRARHSCNIFYDLASEVPCHHFCNILLVILAVWEGTILRAGCHNCAHHRCSVNPI